MALSEPRHQDVQRIYEMILPRGEETPRSLIIQGLPRCGVEEIFTELHTRLKEGWALKENKVLTVTNLSNFWVKPVSQLVRSLYHSIGTDFATPEKSKLVEENLETLEIELTHLREVILKHAERGRQFIFMLDNFDALLKFSEPVQVQHLLNTLQSLGYEKRYHTAFVVRCYRDIEDICQRANYSDFYKIFGLNHYRVSRITTKQVKDFMQFKRPEANPQQIETLADLSAGYPEHAELLLRYEGSVEEICSQAVNDMASVFEEWLNCLSADEQQVLQLILAGGTLGDEHLFAYRKLQRKGIVLEVGEKARLASPLFETYLMNRVGKIHAAQAPLIRKSSLLLSDVHYSLLQQLFQGSYLIEWKLLQNPKPNDATVYLVWGEDQQGTAYRPTIVKIHRSEIIKKELDNTERARKLLGPVVPTVLRQADVKGQKAVVFEYATADNRSYDVRQFADFFRNEATEQVVSLLSRLFERVLWPFYQSQLVKERSAVRLYFLPRPEQGEFEKIHDVVRKSCFYDSARDKLILPGQQFLPNPASSLRPIEGNNECPYHRLFLQKRHAGLCLVHGDLNPRNILVDGIGNVHIIDFAAMKEEGGRFLDVARLEAEIKFKLVDIGPTRENMESSIAVERLLTEACGDTALETLLHLPFTEAVAKMVAAVLALRRSARTICQNSIGDQNFELEYKTALLAQTLRLSLYEDYLSPQQQELAVISAAMLADYLLKLISY